MADEPFDDPWASDPYGDLSTPPDDPWATNEPWTHRAPDEPAPSGPETYDPYHDYYPDILPMPTEPGLVVAPGPQDSNTPNSEESNVTVTPNRPVAPSEGKVVVTLKQGNGYEAPWIVIHAADVLDAKSQLREVASHALTDDVSKVAAIFAASRNAVPVAPRPQAPQGGYQQAPPQQQYQQPTQQGGGGDGRACHHGQMVFKTGTNKFGKPYQAYFCPSPKGTPDQCRATFL